MILVKILLIFVSFNLLAINQIEFLTQLEKNHPYFQQQLLTSQSFIIAKDIANPYQKWILTSKIQGNKESEGGEIINYNSIELSNSLVKQNIDGTTFKVNNSITKNNQTNTYNNNLLAKYTIPLQQNYQGLNNRLNLDLAQIKQKLNAVQSAIDKNNFFANTLKQLWKAKFLKHKVGILEQQLYFEAKQLKLLKTKFNNNLVDKTDILLEENNYQTIRLNLLQSKQELKVLMQKLEVLIDAKINEIDINLEKLISYANNIEINNLKAIKVFDLNIALINRQIKSLQNKQKSQVNFSISANLINKTFSQKTDVVLGVGLDLELPLGSDNNKNLILQKNNELFIMQTQKREKIIDLKNKYNQIIADLRLLSKVININKNQLKINKDTVYEFEKMYKNSNTELRFVIDAKNKELNIKLEYFSNLLKYQTLILDLNTFI